VHFSMKFVREDGRTLDTDNGYNGNVSFDRWYVNSFILENIPQDTIEKIKLTYSELMNKLSFILKLL